MNASEKSARDQLAAELDLAKERLARFRDRTEDTSTELRAGFEARIERVTARAEDLGSQIKEWVELKVGTISAVGDLGAAIDTLEVDLDAAEESDADSYRSLVDRQLRVWRGRAEHLRVQESLGAMEFREELDGLARRLADARSEALVQLRHVRSDARDVVVDLREDLEEVLVDVRHVVERAADALVHRGGGDE